MGDMKMIVGLGNPGEEYVDTRHNTGFKVIDSLSKALGIEVRKRKFAARFGSGEFADKKLILLKPWQFMNRSGQAVATAKGFYKLNIKDLLVITDDMDLEVITDWPTLLRSLARTNLHAAESVSVTATSKMLWTMCSINPQKQKGPCWKRRLRRQKKPCFAG
jgi:hypothetical protein